MKSLFENPIIRKVLVANDLSENSDRAHSYALSLAGAYGAEITVLHVFDKLPPNADLLLVSLLGYGSIEELHSKSEVQIMHRIKKRLEKFCIEAAKNIPTCRSMLNEVIVEAGNASERILHHVATGNYDILVMGSRGLGRIRKAVLGSISRKVLSECRVPLFIVPARIGDRD